MTNNEERDQRHGDDAVWEYVDDQLEGLIYEFRLAHYRTDEHDAKPLAAFLREVERLLDDSSLERLCLVYGKVAQMQYWSLIGDAECELCEALLWGWLNERTRAIGRDDPGGQLCIACFEPLAEGIVEEGELNASSIRLLTFLNDPATAWMVFYAFDIGSVEDLVVEEFPETLRTAFRKAQASNLPTAHTLQFPFPEELLTAWIEEKRDE